MGKVYSDFQGKKAKNVTCIMYLEDWGKTYGELLEFLSDWPYKCACSPVHDKDKYSGYQAQKWIADHMVNGELPQEVIDAGIPKEGQLKKPHVHVMVIGSGPRYADFWAQEFARFHEVNYFEAVRDPDKLLRYFAHMDNPEKAQYSCLDIHGFGGMDLGALMSNDDTSKLQTLIEVMEYVFECNIMHYNKLVRYAFSTGDLDWIACVSGRASFFVNFFKSECDTRNLAKKFLTLIEAHPDVSMDEIESILGM